MILVVVDRFTKFDHFIPLSHPYTASVVVNLFLNYVFKLHGLPKTIVTDRDLIFVSSFWKAFFSLQGSVMNHNSAYHHQSDGQAEALNKCLKSYLRCYVGMKPQRWAQWLAFAKWWYNTSYHPSIKLIPFEALYGYSPPQLLFYVPGTSANNTVDQTLQTKYQIIKLLKENLENAKKG